MTPKTLVERARLYRLLDRASQSPLTMVVAPAGTGKTVLLSAWVDQLTAPQRDRVCFLSASEHHELTGLLSSDSSADPPDAIVIDDAHLLSAAQLGALSRALAATPHTLRTVVASRRDLPLPVVQLELRGAATMIRAGHLRFDDGEAEELARAHATDISAGDVRTLQERTGGWAAALVLGARTVARDMIGGVVTSISTDQPVLDFLLGDAFTALQKPVRHLLLSTFDEPAITAERAAVLSDNPDASALLSELVNDGLLVTAYAQGHSDDVVYRYHPLLIELLRRRVVKGGAEGATLAAAHRRAAIHDAAHGDSASALHHAIAARDDDLVTSLLVELGPTMLWSGQADVVTAAIERLPGEAMEQYPQLLGVASQLRRTTGDTAGAVTLARRARKAARRIVERPVRTRSPMDDALVADALLLRLWQARYGWQDASSTIAEAHDTLHCRHGSESGAGHDLDIDISPERLAWLMVELAVVEIWVGDVASAGVHIDEALVSARQVDHPRLLAATLAHRAFIELISGAVQTADETAEEALVQARRAHAVDDPVHDRARIVLAWTAWHRCELELATARLAKIDPGRVTRSDAVLGTYISLLRASLLSEDGRLDDARRELADAPEAPGTLPPFLARSLAIMSWHCAMLAGDNSTAAAQLEILTAAGYLVEVDLLTTLSESLSGRTEDAIDEIERLVDQMGMTDPVLAAAAAAARVAMLIRAGDTASARLAITDVLSRVAPQRTVFALTAGAWAEPQFLDLLVEESERADAHPFAADALAALTHRLNSTIDLEPQAVLGHDRGASQTGHRPDAIAPHAVALPRPRAAEVLLHGFPVALTAREVDVLEQLALGSSYTEIGRALYITENTVKTHLASLYRKLGVDKRSAALRVSRELGLL